MQLLTTILYTVLCASPQPNTTPSMNLSQETLTFQTEIHEITKIIQVQNIELEKLKKKYHALDAKENDGFLSGMVTTLFALASILLALVAIALAVFGLLGFLSIKKATKKQAEKIATKIASEVAKEGIDKKISDKCDEIISKLLDEGYFMEIATKAVDNTSYRNIWPEEDNVESDN